MNTEQLPPKLESDEIIDGVLNMLRADCIKLDREIEDNNYGGVDSTQVKIRRNMLERYLVHLADQVAIRNIHRMLKTK